MIGRHQVLKIVLSTTLLVAAVILGAAGCEKSSRVSPESSTPPGAQTANRPDTSNKPVDLPHGSVVPFSDARVLLEGPGLRLEEQRWRFDGRAGYLWRVRLPRDAPTRVLTSGSLTRVEEMTRGQRGSFAAINGGFYRETLFGHEPLGLVVADGDEEEELRSKGGSGVVFFDGTRLDIVHRDSFDADDDAITQALQSIDRLVDGGKSLVRRRPDPQRAARAAVALTDDAIWLVVLAGDASVQRRGGVVTLTKTGRDGVPLWAFAQLLVESIGPKRALNLDGAVSTQLTVQVGEASRGEREFVIRGDRGVLNALLVSAP